MKHDINLNSSNTTATHVHNWIVIWGTNTSNRTITHTTEANNLKAKLTKCHN